MTAVRTERGEARRDALAEAQRVVMAEGRRQGLSAETAEATRAAIEGRADNAAPAAT